MVSAMNTAFHEHHLQRGLFQPPRLSGAYAQVLGVVERCQGCPCGDATVGQLNFVMSREDEFITAPLGPFHIPEPDGAAERMAVHRRCQKSDTDAVPQN